MSNCGERLGLDAGIFHRVKYKEDVNRLHFAEVSMRDLYMKALKIEKVRHLKDIEIPISGEYPKHLILTGKNGSGKTSVLEAMSRYLHGGVNLFAYEVCLCFFCV